jgi:hypothetical protein
MAASNMARLGTAIPLITKLENIFWFGMIASSG